MPGAYETDLAYIHDTGFTGYLHHSAPGLLSILRSARVTAGSVTDLGCGSGRWAAILNHAGYSVTGIDSSPAMLKLARANAPDSRFVLDSLCTADLPTPCDAVTSISECMSYAFDTRTRRAGLPRLFRRIFAALRPGGVFLFDFATPNIIPDPQPSKSWWQAGDWAVLVETSGDWRRNTLTRQITSFRRSGILFRRVEETHLLSLYHPHEMTETLRAAGFAVRMHERYGRYTLPPGITAFVAHKPRGTVTTVPTAAMLKSNKCSKTST